MRSASMTMPRDMSWRRLQPITWRLNRSTTTARNSHPPSVAIYAMSPARNLSGSLTVNSRFRRLGAIGSSWLLSVVATRKRQSRRRRRACCGGPAAQVARQGYGGGLASGIEASRSEPGVAAGHDRSNPPAPTLRARRGSRPVGSHSHPPHASTATPCSVGSSGGVALPPAPRPLPPLHPAATPAKAGAARRSERDAAAVDNAAHQVAHAQSKAAQAAAREAEDWPGRLQQALGNDAALLEVAGNAPRLDIKLAAVEGLAGEDALRQAERAFRSRDRKVHRLAKSRLGAAVSRRKALATAEQLLQRGQALLQDPQLPLNHLATLDRDWQALPAALLEPAQHVAFTTLRAQLDSTVRARADAEQQLQRWTAQTQRSLPTWKAAVAAASSQPLEQSARSAGRRAQPGASAAGNAAGKRIHGHPGRRADAAAGRCRRCSGLGRRTATSTATRCGRTRS